jgi:hypothetical protein
LLCDRNLKAPYPTSSDPKDSNVVATINVLTLVQGLSDQLSRELSDHEVKVIFETFQRALHSFSSINSLGQLYPLAESARLDLRKSAEICVNDHTGRGMSRWHSLQAIEKLLKLFIEIRGGTSPQNHNLGQLDSIARSLGSRGLDRAQRKAVQCNADVRYKSEQVSLIEAATSHLEAICLAQSVTAEVWEVVRRASPRIQIGWGGPWV